MKRLLLVVCLVLACGPLTGLIHAQEATDDCPGLEIQDPVVADWMLSLSQDHLLPRQGGALPIFLRNTMDEPITLSSTVTVSSAGGQIRVPGPTVSLAGRAGTQVEIALPSGVDTSSFSAQLQVVFRPYENGRRMSDTEARFLYFHREPFTGRTRVYDEQGLLQRHQAGDLKGQILSMVPTGERQNLGGIFHGRLLTARDLQADQP